MDKRFISLMEKNPENLPESIVQTHKKDSLSDKYAFVPTYAIYNDVFSSLFGVLKPENFR